MNNQKIKTNTKSEETRYNHKMNPHKHSSTIGSIKNASKGILHGATGRNFKLQILAGIAVLALAYYLPLLTMERYIVIMLIALVLSMELINTAIEELADALIQEHHPGIARVKEISAAGVLVVAITSAIIGVGIFLPYL